MSAPIVVYGQEQWMLGVGWGSGSKDRSNGRADGSEMSRFCFSMSSDEDGARCPVSASAGCSAHRRCFFNSINEYNASREE